MVRVSRRILLGATASVPASVALAGLAGCSDDEGPGQGDTPSEPDQVRVLTGLGFQGREAYLDVAAANGYFEESNLEVEILPGEGTGQNLTLLSGGQAEFATLDVNAAMIEYANGTFTDFVLSCVLHANLLSCIMAQESSGITRPADLAGTRIAVIPGGINTVAFPVFAELAGFDAASVEQVNLPPPAFGAALAEGQVDAIMQFVVGQHAIERAAGTVVVFPYAEWIPELYGSGIGVSRQLVTDNPDLVRRFNQAALRGLEFAVQNPQEAAEIFVERREGQDLDTAVAENQALAEYVHADEGLQLGQFSDTRLAQTATILESLGAITDFVEPGDLVSFELFQ